MSAVHYEIAVEGQLDRDRWSSWFGGMEVSPSGAGCTTISGPLTDQAALHGLLAKVRDLGLVLVSVQRKSPEGGLRSPRRKEGVRQR